MNLSSNPPVGGASASSLTDRDLVFGISWCRGQSEQIGRDARVLLLLRDTQSVLRLAGSVPANLAPGEALRAAATAAAEMGRPILRAAGQGRITVAMAVEFEQGIAAVAAADVLGDTETDGPAILRQLQWGMAGVDAFLHKAAGLAEQSDDEALSQETKAKAGLTIFLRALETPGFKDAARAAATDLAQELGADRIAITRLPKVPARSRLVALSHAADFGRASAATDAVRAAADEALDQSEALLWPPEETAPALARHSLEALARQSGAGSVAAIPMGGVLEPWGALVAEFSNPDAALQAAPSLGLAADALAPLLELKRQEDRWLPRRIWDALLNGAATVLGAGHLGWKAAAIVLAGLCFAAATVTAPARVTADAVLSAEGRVLVSAPFDGILAERRVEPGESVSEGQILLMLDERELILEQLRDEAARSQKSIERDTASAAGDRARFAVLTAEMAEIDARLALTAARLKAGRMAAPFDGIVTGDTTDGRIGAPVARGEELMSLAPSDIRSVTLFVPDARIDRVAIGQTGQMRLAADPDQSLAFLVTRITPVTEARDGANTFKVQAELIGEVPPDLTHGMEGAAKIVTGRSLWVKTWGQPLIEDLRLAVWSLLP